MALWDDLVDRLKVMANSKYTVHTITPARLPEGKDELGVFLSRYDCILMANLPAELLNSEQQEMLRSNTRVHSSSRVWAQRTC